MSNTTGIKGIIINNRKEYSTLSPTLPLVEYNELTINILNIVKAMPFSKIKQMSQFSKVLFEVV